MKQRDKLEVRYGALEAEAAFVLAIARSFGLGLAPDATLREIRPIIPAVRSWERVEQFLRVHRCTTLAYSVLTVPEIQQAELVPEGFLSSLRDAYRIAFIRTSAEPSVVYRLLDAFTVAGIPALLIKGLALGTWLYGDLALREHDDIDLLIPGELQLKADVVLKQLNYSGGYRPPIYPGESPSTASYLSKIQDPSIDLSFDPLQVFLQASNERKASFSAWWARRQTLQLGDRLIPTLGPEDQFLQLMRHLQFHNYFRANWWVDVVLLLRHRGAALDWSLIASEATRNGIKGGIFRSIELFEDVYGVEIPPSAKKEIAPAWPVRSLHRRIWSDDVAVPRGHRLPEHEGTPISPRFLSLSGAHPFTGLLLFTLEGRRIQIARYLVQRIVPPIAWLRQSYGDGTRIALLYRHWNSLFELRKRVRQKHGR